MSTWTDEKRAQAVKLYTEMNPTATTSAECVKAVAEQMKESPNGVRIILVKEGAYIKATGGSAASAKAKAASDKAPRVSKQQAFADLVSAINDSGQEPDMEVIDKLTGKQAVYFTTIIRALEQKEGE